MNFANGNRLGASTFEFTRRPLNETAALTAPSVRPARAPFIVPDFESQLLTTNSKIFLSSNHPNHLPAFSHPKKTPSRSRPIPPPAILKPEKARPATLHPLAGHSIYEKKRITIPMNRKERRAAAHNERKLARKAGFPTPQPKPQPTGTRAAADRPPGNPNPPLPSPTRQLTANRANAQLSTGPKTEAGRAISSQNRTTHGLARHNGAFILLSTEDPNGFEALKASLADEHQPSTETESILVNTMAESHWLANRAQTLQNTCLDPQTGQITDAALFSLYLRYQTTHTRAFHKSLNDLLKLRSERRKAENGFEAQNRKKEELRIKNERHEMKKEHHEWDIRLKDAAFCHRAGQNVANFNKAIRENPGFEAQYIAEVDRLLQNRRPEVAKAAA